MSDRETAAARLVAIRVLRDWLTEVDQVTRDRMLADMLPGDRQQAPVGADRTIVGAVTRSKPGKDKTAARVVDPARFLAWVRDYTPGNVIVTTTVDPLFVQSLLARIDRDPEYVTCDENGEVLPLPPGVELGTTAGAKSTLRVIPDEGAADVIRAALAAGELTWGELLALPAGGAS